MTFIEFLGFIITLIVMSIIVLKKTMGERQERNRDRDSDRRKNSNIYRNAGWEEKRKEKAVRKLLKSLDIDVEEDEKQFARVAKQRPPQQQAAKPKPPRIVGDEYKFKDKLDNYHPITSIEKRNYKSPIEEQGKRLEEKIVSSDFLQRESDAYSLASRNRMARGKRVIQNLKTKKDMMILHEILSQPKGML